MGGYSIVDTLVTERVSYSRKDVTVEGCEEYCGGRAYEQAGLQGNREVWLADSTSTVPDHNTNIILLLFILLFDSEWMSPVLIYAQCCLWYCTTAYG